MKNIKKNLDNFFFSFFNLKKNKIKEFKKIKSFDELHRFDSLIFIKMLIKIENKFQVSFKNENFKKMLNKKYLEKKIISRVKK